MACLITGPLTEGFRCPNCGQSDRVHISIFGSITLNKNGSWKLTSGSYNKLCNCYCDYCKYSATVGEFNEQSLPR